MARAAVCHQFGEELELEEMSLDPPRPDEVRVRVTACGVCHSDLAYASGIWGGSLPAVMVSSHRALSEEQPALVPGAADRAFDLRARRGADPDAPAGGVALEIARRFNISRERAPDPAAGWMVGLSVYCRSDGTMSSIGRAGVGG